MLQRQNVGAAGKQIDIECLVWTKDAITSFHSMSSVSISVNVTTYRTVPLQKYQGISNHCIMMTMTTKLKE